MGAIRKNSAFLLISVLVTAWVFGVSLMGAMGHLHDSVCPLSGMLAVLCPMTVFFHIQQLAGLFAVPVVSFAFALVVILALVLPVSRDDGSGERARNFYTHTKRYSVISSLELAFADGTIQPRFFA